MDSLSLNAMSSLTLQGSNSSGALAIMSILIGSFNFVS